MIGKARRFPATIVVDGKVFSVKTIQIAVGNGRYYGGGMPIAHDAAIDDQRLDLYSIELERWWQIFPLVWHLPRGQQHLLKWVRTVEGREIEIHTSKAYKVNTDGEITTITPAKFRVIPNALQVFVP